MRLPPRLVITVAILTASVVGIANAQEKSGFHYRVQVRVGPALHKLDAEAWIQQPPSFRFYLHKGLSVHQVTADGKAVAFHLDSSASPLPYTGGSAAVVLDAHDAQELHVKYGGEISEVVSGVNLITPELVELAFYSAWYPLFQEGKGFTFEVEANLPQGYVTTTNGRQKTRPENDGRSITRWTSYEPGHDIVLLASPHLHQLESGVKGTHVEIYYYRLPAQLLRSKIDGLVAGMDRLTRLYGTPHGEGILRLAYSPRSGWGYARNPLIIVSEERARWVLSQEAGEARDFRDNCHEMAHFWWSISDPETPDDWINEGLAEFTACRLAEERFGKAFAEKLIAEYRQNAGQSKTTSSIAETETTSPDREINRYDRAALMFLEARSRFGEDPLDKVLKALHTRFAGTRQATTLIFLKEVRAQMGNEAEAFFREELYRKPTVGSGDKTAPLN
jgi:hypothetical protein